MKWEDAIQEIKRRVSITDVVGRYVKLRQRGTSAIGVCPFHNEKTPSFNVRSDKGYFKCFGCNVSGDVFTFLEKITGQLFADVVRQLASDLKIDLDSDQTRESDGRAKQHQRLHEALDAAFQYYRKALFEDVAASTARDYLLKERKLTPAMVEKYELGFGGSDDRTFFEALRKAGVQKADAIELGLAREGDFGTYHFFARRILFPIRDKRGQLVAFGGRAFGPSAEGKPKYINSQQSVIYHKSQTFYGLDRILPRLKVGEPAVIVEGFFDAIAVSELGFATIAPCGTAMTDDHVADLARYTKTAILCFDQDDAGRSAQEKLLLPMLKAGFHVRAAQLSAKDPDLMWRSGQGALLQNMIAKAPDALEFRIKQEGLVTANSANARAQALQKLVPIFAALPDDITVNQYVRFAASTFLENERMLQKEVQKLRPKSSARVSPLPQKAAVALDVAKHKPWSEMERLLLCALLRKPSLFTRVAVERDHIQHPDFQTLMVELGRILLPAAGVLETADLLAQVQIARSSSVVPMLRQILARTELLTDQHAEQVVEDWLSQIKQTESRKGLKASQEGLLQAQLEGDVSKVRAMLWEQSAQIKSLSKAKKKKHEEAAPKE